MKAIWLKHGYKAILISTIVDKRTVHWTYIGYKAILISTIVDGKKERAGISGL